MSIKSSKTKNVKIASEKRKKGPTQNDIKLFKKILSKKLSEASEKPLILRDKDKVNKFIENKILSAVKELRSQTNKEITTYDLVVPDREIDTINEAAKDNNMILSSYEDDGIIIFHANSVNFK